MKIPLLLLSIGAISASLIPFGKYVSSDGSPLEIPFHLDAAILPVCIALAGILLAAYLYKSENDKADAISSSLGVLYKAALRKFYIDELYLFITRKIIFPYLGRPAAWIDRYMVDASVNGIASAVAWKSDMIKGVQSGKVQDYAVWFFAGIFGLTLLAIYLLN